MEFGLFSNSRRPFRSQADTSDPRQPEEIAHFVPPDPLERRGLFRQTGLVAQTEDVLVDSRGYIYITDKTHGIVVLKQLSKPGCRRPGHASEPVRCAPTPTRTLRTELRTSANAPSAVGG